jgi:hypothetical protein
MTLLYKDDFNRAPTNDLHSSPSTGIDGEFGGWDWTKRNTSGSGVFGISGNHVVHGAFSNVRFAGPPIELDYELSDKISGQKMTVPDLIGAGVARFFTHHVNDSNYIHAGYDGANAYVRVVTDGVGVTAAIQAVAFPSLPFDVAVWSLAAGQISVSVDGVTILDAVNATADLVFAQAGTFGMAGFNEVLHNDDYNGGAPWLIGLTPAPSEVNESDPAVQRRLLDEQRRASLLGGRQNTILTSPLGLTDDVPIAKIHPIGRCS